MPTQRFVPSSIQSRTAQAIQDNLESDIKLVQQYKLGK